MKEKKIINVLSLLSLIILIGCFCIAGCGSDSDGGGIGGGGGVPVFPSSTPMSTVTPASTRIPTNTPTPSATPLPGDVGGTYTASGASPVSNPVEIFLIGGGFIASSDTIGGLQTAPSPIATAITDGTTGAYLFDGTDVVYPGQYTLDAHPNGTDPNTTATPIARTYVSVIVEPASNPPQTADELNINLTQGTYDNTPTPTPTPTPTNTPTSTPTVEPTSTPTPSSREPHGISFQGTYGNKILVAEYGSGTVAIFEPTFSDVRHIAVGNGPEWIASSTTQAFVTNSLDGTISVVNITNETVDYTLDLSSGATPLGITIDDSLANIYVADNGNGWITQIAVGSNAITEEFITMPSGVKPLYIQYAASQLVVSADDGNVYIYPASGGAYDHVIASGTNPRDLDAYSSNVIISNNGSDTITGVSTSGNQLFTSGLNLAVGDGPFGVDIFEYNSSYGYVVNMNENNISEINIGTGVVSDFNISGGTLDAPYDISSHGTAAGGYFYVTNSGSDTIFKINQTNGAVETTIDLTE